MAVCAGEAAHLLRRDEVGLRWGGVGEAAGADRLVQLGAHLSEQLELFETPRPLFLPLCVLLVVVLLAKVLVEQVAARAAPLRVGGHVTEREYVPG